VQTAVFSTLVFCQLAHALTVHAGHLSIWRAGVHNRLLVWALLISVGLQLLVLTTSVGQDLFGTVDMPIELWVAIALATLGSLLAIDLTKLVLGPFDR
jgi:Ca2+-transporting ATPase